MTADGAILLLQETIRCDTVGGGKERALAELLHRRLIAAGVDSRLLEVDGRTNLLAVIRGVKAGPVIVFSGHTDTVPLGENPWRIPPLGAEIHDGRLYGRGSTDMKGGLVALLAAFMRQAGRDPAEWGGTLYFAATFGEETGAEGALALVASGALPAFDAMIIAEPTDNSPVVAHKGVFWVRVEATGRTGHASMPHSGVNAVGLLHSFVTGLGDCPQMEAAPDDLLGRPSLSVTVFNGGQQVNVIPDRAWSMLDIRSLPGQSHADILDWLRDLAARTVTGFGGGSLVVSPQTDLPAVRTNAAAPVVQAACASLAARRRKSIAPHGANYFTDGSAFQAIGGDILVLGPGLPEQAHQTDEYIEIDRFLEAIEIYDDILGTMTIGGRENPGMAADREPLLQLQAS